MTSRHMGRLLGVLLAIGCGLGAVPAAAQSLVLYEVTESMTFRGLKKPHRIAVAALFGTVPAGSLICPTDAGPDGCGVNVIALDALAVATGKGPVTGWFQVTVQGDNLVDGPEALILAGDLLGEIDLSPTLADIPLGSIAGSWRATGAAGTSLAGVRLAGKFTGAFRLPFRVGDTEAYLLDDGTVVPVLPNERSIGFATVRLEIAFE